MSPKYFCLALVLAAATACGRDSGSSLDGNNNVNDGADSGTNTNTNTNDGVDAGVDPGVDAGPCTPDCTGRECGDDGCGGTCAPGCTGDESCSAAGQCASSYVLYNGNGTKTTYLLDRSGAVAHQWNNARSGGYSVYLLENGNILRPAQATNMQLNGGAAAGLVQEIAPDGTVVWQYEYNTASYLTHHDIEPMPNGNVLLIAWEVKSSAEAVAAGRESSSEIWPDHIIEVQPSGTTGGTIVWEWHAWDHLVQDYDATKDNFGVVSDHPELLDVNMGESHGPPGMGGDWLHINGISYNPERDEIVISSHFMNEIYVIDHSTTTAEAASHSGGARGKGGDLLYRWGNPANYASGTQIFYVVHCSAWVPAGFPGAGNILAFNNGDGRPGGDYSSIEEIVIPVDAGGDYLLSGATYGPTAPTWTYSSGSSFYSNHLGGVQRLADGNTLIAESTSGYLFEVTSAGSTVWSYQASGEVARALQYSADHAGINAILNY